MTDSQLDEIFKNQLPGHESPVPEDMWERIVLKKDKDRKGFFFFFSLIGLILLGFGIAGILLFNINKKGNEKEQQNISHSKVVANADTAQSAVTGPDSKKVPSLKNQTAYGRVDTFRTAFRHKDHLKNTIPAGYRQAGILQTQWKTKKKSAGTGQIQPDVESATGFSEDRGPKDNSKLSPDSSKLSDQEAKPVISSTPGLFTSDSAKNTATKKQDSTKSKAGKKWSLELYVSPDYPLVYGEPYVKSKLSYTAGLRLNRSFGRHFSGKIGIQFSQIKYVLGDSGLIAGPNHLKSLDLPVLAGYSWGNESLGMTMNAGFIFNLYSWFDAGSISYFKTNTGLSLYLGVHFEKQINDRLSLFTEPYYRYRLSPMTVSSVNFLKFIDVAGLSFGARFYFKK